MARSSKTEKTADGKYRGFVYCRTRIATGKPYVGETDNENERKRSWDNKGSGVLSDETIRLTGYYSTRKYPDTLRLVVYEDFETGKVYRFLTNNFAIEDPLTIAELYRERWQIELFFK